MPEQEATVANGKFINFDQLLVNGINMKVCLPQGENGLFGKVIGACFDKEVR